MLHSNTARLVPFHLALAFFAASLHASELQVKIRPIGLSEQDAQALTLLASKKSALGHRLRGSRYRILNASFGQHASAALDKHRGPRGDEESNPTSYELEVYDYTHDRLLVVKGGFDPDEPAVYSETDLRPAPTPEETQEAQAILSADSHFGPTLRPARW